MCPPLGTGTGSPQPWWPPTCVTLGAGTGSHGTGGKHPWCQKAQPQHKARLGDGISELRLEHSQCSQTLPGWGSPGATGDGNGSSHPWGMPKNINHPWGMPKTLRACRRRWGIKEGEREEAHADTHTHTRLCIPPSLIELINLAEIQRSVICLIQWEERQQQQPALIPRSLCWSCQGLSTPGQLRSPHSSHQSHQCWPRAQHQQHPSPEELQLKIPKNPINIPHGCNSQQEWSDSKPSPWLPGALKPPRLSLVYSPGVKVPFPIVARKLLDKGFLKILLFQRLLSFLSCFFFFSPLMKMLCAQRWSGSG